MSNILVTKSSMPPYEEYCEEIKGLWESHWLTNMGVKHKELQNSLEEYLDVPHIALYTNGHLALENAIAALNLPEGGEVITTPFTFASTTHAIVRNGLVPVFCDIKEDDYTIDTEKLELLINDNTVAIVPVHVYGNMCDVEEIDRIAKKYGMHYSSNLCDDDRPYQKDLENGETLLEIPIHWDNYDLPYFAFNYHPAFPKGQGRIANYTGVINNWKDEFYGCYEYGLCYVLQLDPAAIGAPGRIGLLEELLDYIDEFDSVWWTSGEEMYQYYQNK